MKKDTISALATPVGGAICVIRLSGPDAISIADTIFSRDIATAKANTLHYGEIMDDDRCVVDDVIIAVFGVTKRKRPYPRERFPDWQRSLPRSVL